MGDLDALTNAFLSSHPAAAARVLEDLPAAEAAALFDRVPARLAAPVLTAMLPPAAARCLMALDAQRGALLLGALAPNAATAALRHVGEPARSRMLDALPTAAAIACRTLLGYPDDTVGAWVDTAIVALPPEHRAHDAVEAVRGSGDAYALQVYVVGNDHRLLGVAALPELLRSMRDARLDTLMREPPAAMPAVTSLAGAAMHPGWERTSALPVVERGERLIGVIHRGVLQRVLEGRAARRAPAGSSTAGVLAGAYWQAVASLIEATVSLLPRASRKPR